MRPKSDLDLADALLERLRGRLSPGEWSGMLEAGDLVLDVQVRVRRRVGYTDAAGHISRALARLEALPFHSGRCGAALARRRGFFGSHCTRPIAVVVVDRDYRGAERLTFACQRHGAQQQAEPGVVAVLALPRARLRALRAEHERRSAARDAWEQAVELGAEGVVAFIRAVRGDDNELARRRAMARR